MNNGEYQRMANATDITIEERNPNDPEFDEIENEFNSSEDMSNQ